MKELWIGETTSQRKILNNGWRTEKMRNEPFTHETWITEMPKRFNFSYELTKFESIPDSKSTSRDEPVTCPHCGHSDYENPDEFYTNGEKIPKELPF